MIIGYARTSTIDQIAGFESQLKALRAVNCGKIFQEQVSSVGERLQLAAALEYVREGDVQLDRLARSVADLMTTVQTLDRKIVGLRVLDPGMDTHTPTGKLMLTVLEGVAQFEREMLLERQREGVAKAKAEGRYKGQKPVSSERRDAVLQLAALGTTEAGIARQLALGEATVYRILAAAKGAGSDLCCRRGCLLHSQMALLAAMWSLPLDQHLTSYCCSVQLTGPYRCSPLPQRVARPEAAGGQV